MHNTHGWYWVVAMLLASPVALAQTGKPRPTGPQIVPRAQQQLRTAAKPRLPAPTLDKTQLFEHLRRQRAQAEAAAEARARDEAGAAQTAQALRYEQARLAQGLTHRYGRGDDCDDTRRDVHRLAAEVCDGIDNNCDGLVDEGQKLAFFLDQDGDGHGDPALVVDACPVDQQRAAREGRWLVSVGNDCDDQDAQRWHGCEQ